MGVRDTGEVSKLNAPFFRSYLSRFSGFLWTICIRENLSSTFGRWAIETPLPPCLGLHACQDSAAVGGVRLVLVPRVRRSGSEIQVGESRMVIRTAPQGPAVLALGFLDWQIIDAG